jgi:hypothetical protein
MWIPASALSTMGQLEYLHVDYDEIVDTSIVEVVSTDELEWIFGV